VTEGVETRPDNIPATVDRINELLDQAHATVSRIRPKPAESGEVPEASGLEASVIRARDKALDLSQRLVEIADAVGTL